MPTKARSPGAADGQEVASSLFLCTLLLGFLLYAAYIAAAVTLVFMAPDMWGIEVDRLWGQDMWELTAE